jgi:nitroreductase
MKHLLFSLAIVSLALCVQAQDIKLPTPKKTGGMPFYEAVNNRKSERSYVKKEMPLQTLSNLLWVANGFNRDDKRTVPTASNKQEMELYVVINDNAYFYDAKANVLKHTVKGDFKAGLGQPNISDNAAVSLVLVADLDKSSIESARISSGYISQNIYLFAAAEGLGTVARGSFKANELKEALKLTEKQAIILVQPVGYLK